MKDNNYYVVYGWMVNKLKLKGTALQLYAVIYGFSQDGDSECSGSLAFLAETTGCTKQTILNGLDKLERLGYIQKRQTRDSDGGLRNHYRVNLSAIESAGDIPQYVESECGKTVESKVGTPKNFTHEVKKSQCPQSKNKNAPSQKSRPNNTIREYIDYEGEFGTRSPKKRFGEFANVYLTSEEYDKLHSIYGNLLSVTLSSLSTYMASTGRKYHNHYATLYRWCKQDKEQSETGFYRSRGSKNETIPISPKADVYRSLIYNRV